MKCKLLIVGVGGQGILTTNQIIGNTAVEDGRNILASEVHGMAQRGGSVRSMIKIGDFHSPLMGHGSANVVLGLEPAEVLREIDRIGKNARVLVNPNPIEPPSVTVGGGEYPDVGEILKAIGGKTDKIWRIDANQLAEEAGSSRTTNTVMVGALSQVKKFPLGKETLKKTTKKTVPSKYVEENMKAFELGRREIS